MEYFRGPFFKIRVVNIDTGAIYVHNKVPEDHVGMIELNSNLRVEILSSYRNGGVDEKEVYTDLFIDDT